MTTDNASPSTQENEEFVVGQLVTVKYETYGLKEKCMEPDNMGKTIRPWDNVHLYPGEVGLVVGFVGHWHTCMVIVLWGVQKLAITENKLIKATIPAK